MSPRKTARSLLWFQESGEVTQHYKQIRESVDVKHGRIYRKAVEFSQQNGTEEGMPHIIRGRQTRPNPSVASPCDSWRVTITIPLLDSIVSELESRLASDKQAHFELAH